MYLFHNLSIFLTNNVNLLKKQQQLMKIINNVFLMQPLGVRMTLSFINIIFFYLHILYVLRKKITFIIFGLSIIDFYLLKHAETDFN